ncbi:AI-2E family transporter [Deinococcus radiotolerans]|uniref:AI-2E family transporter n=1 Tax=Deinococcus radiotolerans TaxID=1309407 RepID=A0ABQ2FF13_9DEIO|nr:AI-2E family transporter [Deinococcus radiotolerans]GGK89854.1 AI-2E family transporter [Deinococcus radiotolerans]
MTAPDSRPPASIFVVNLLPVATAVIALLLLLSFFGQVAPSLLAITLAVILATALNPLARRLERWMPRAAAGTLTVLLVVAVLGVTAYLTIPPILAQLSSIGSSTFDLSRIEPKLNAWLRSHPQMDAMLPDDAFARAQAQLTKLSARVTEMLPSLAGLIIGGIFTALVTLVMVVYVLGNPVPLVNGVLGAVPPTHRLKATYALAQILKQTGAWGRATLLVMLVTGSCTALGFYLLGVQNWLVFGILAGLGELVPNIGPVIATIPPILFTLAEDPQRALWVALFVLVFQQVSGFTLSTFLVGGAGNLHPLSVLTGVILFGGVFGLVGAFLTVPFLIVIKAIYQHFYLREAPDIPDAVAMALISGVVEEQLEREDEAREAVRKARAEVQEAELERQLEQGELDLEAALSTEVTPDEPQAEPDPEGRSGSADPRTGP